MIDCCRFVQLFWGKIKSASVQYLSLHLQNVDILRPVEPQVHDLFPGLVVPTFSTLIADTETDPQTAHSEPTPPPDVQPPPSDPAPSDRAPSDPPVVVSAPNLISPSSSSESAEGLLSQQRRPDPFDSSSEEVGLPVALRPPFNFRYQKPDRKKRQALVRPSATHNPVFLSEFPGGVSPFRSCPGPSRYTTV